MATSSWATNHCGAGHVRLIQPEFHFIMSTFAILPESHAQLSSDRHGMILAARREAANNHDLSGYGGVMVFLNPPHLNAGAWGSDSALDQAGIIPVYQHEVGHMLGFQHSYGVAVSVGGDDDGPSTTTTST
jgi:hypothetical protein